MLKMRVVWTKSHEGRGVHREIVVLFTEMCRQLKFLIQLHSFEEFIVKFAHSDRRFSRAFRKLFDQGHDSR